jgi:hypothetical protein
MIKNNDNKDPNWASRSNNDDRAANRPARVKRVCDIIFFATAIVKRITMMLHLCGVVNLQSLQERVTDLLGIVL